MKLIFIRKQKNLPLNMKTFHKNMKFGITGKLNVKEKKERFASNRFYLIFAHQHKKKSLIKCMYVYDCF